jgi:hypothetical protein
LFNKSEAAVKNSAGKADRLASSNDLNLLENSLARIQVIFVSYFVFGARNRRMITLIDEVILLSTLLSVALAIVMCCCASKRSLSCNGNPLGKTAVLTQNGGNAHTIRDAGAGKLEINGCILKLPDPSSSVEMFDGSLHVDGLRYVVSGGEWVVAK